MRDPAKTNSYPKQSWLMGLASSLIAAAVLLLAATAAGFVLWAVFR